MFAIGTFRYQSCELSRDIDRVSQVGLTCMAKLIAETIVLITVVVPNIPSTNTMQSSVQEAPRPPHPTQKTGTKSAWFTLFGEYGRREGPFCSLLLFNSYCYHRISQGRDKQEGEWRRATCQRKAVVRGKFFHSDWKCIDKLAKMLTADFQHKVLLKQLT